MTLSMVLRISFVAIALSLSASPAYARGNADTAEARDGFSPRKPPLALGLSLLLPGTGQIYNGEYAKAAVHFGLFAGSVALVSSAGIGSSHESITTFGWVSAVLVGITYLWAGVDAAVSAGRINEEHGVSVALNLESVPGGMRAVVALRI